MKTRWNTEGTQTYFIISDLDSAFENIMKELGFIPYDDGFAKIYPTTTPHLEIFYHNFARSAEEMILQRAGVHSIPWDQALQALLQRLAQYNIQWWLIGSAALAVRGLDIIPHDLDLIVDDEGAIKLGEIMSDALIGPVEDAHGWISTWFGRAFLHSRIEWAGGIRTNVDEYGVTEFGPTAGRRLETITWRGYPLLIPPLDIQRDVNERRGLKDRVRKIEQRMLY